MEQTNPKKTQSKKAIKNVVTGTILVVCGILYYTNGTPKPVSPEPVNTTPTQESSTESTTPKTPTTATTTTPATTTPRYVINKDFSVSPIDPAGNKKIVLLTIDDGPASKKILESLLKAMTDENVHAIFFDLGQLVTAHPELLKETKDAGHAIGNHTWDHANLKKISEADAKSEIDRATTAITKVLGEAPKFFRPPYGAHNDYVDAYVKEKGMLLMNWSLGGEDWVKQYQSKDALTKHVLEQLQPGANILLHEHQWTAEAMPGIIKGIKDAGYTIIDPKEIQTL